MTIDKTIEERVKAIASALRHARRVLFITGAGISAESGLPTYRGIGGLYNDGTTDDGMPIEQVLSGETLRTRPDITWKYLAHIEERCRVASFNRAHKIIAEFETYIESVVVLTQNIDGFHQQAGSQTVIDIHGDIHTLLCTHCGWRRTIQHFSEITVPPLCPDCTQGVRPDVVFFGEMLSPEKVDALYTQLHKGFDVYFSVGTTSVFPYISQPIVNAAARGKYTVEINPGVTDISSIVDIQLPIGATEALEAVLAVYVSERNTEEATNG